MMSLGIPRYLILLNLVLFHLFFVLRVGKFPIMTRRGGMKRGGDKVSIANVIKKHAQY